MVTLAYVCCISIKRKKAYKTQNYKNGSCMTEIIGTYNTTKRKDGSCMSDIVGYEVQNRSCTT